MKNIKSEGFTFIEVLVSILISSIITSLIVLCLQISIKSITLEKKKISQEFEFFKIETEVRNNIQNISFSLIYPELYLISDTKKIQIFSSNYEELFYYKLPQNIIIKNSNFIFSSSNKPIGIQIDLIIENKSYCIKELFTRFAPGAIFL